jgi:hypothetical protein
MAIVLDGTNGISTPDLESAGPVSGTTGTFSGAVSGTTGTFSGAVSGTTGTFSGAVRASGVATNIYPLVSATAVTASGTAVDFTGIPSWVKRITVLLSAVSTNGTSLPLFQLGDSGGVENTGYVVTSSVSIAGTAEVTSTAGFPLYQNQPASNMQGAIVFYLVDPATNSWVGNGTVGVNGNTSVCIVGGRKSLSATLDRIRITTVNGTDTFDAGSINIMYE